MQKTVVRTKEQARQKAIDWQAWSSEQNLSWAEMIHWHEYFDTLAHQFNLIDEFKENGIL